MKKLVATITAAAMLTSLSVSAFAQTDGKQALQNTAGGAHLANMVGKEVVIESDKPTSIDDAKLTLVLSEVLMETFSSYLTPESEYYGIDKECYDKSKTIVDNCDSDYITDEDNKVFCECSFSLSLIYLITIDGMPPEEVLASAVNEASTYYNTLEDCDLKDYMSILLEQARNTTDFSTEDAKTLWEDLLTPVIFVKGQIPFMVGDVDQNGKVTTLDALIIARNLAGLVEFAPYEKYLADANRDSKISSIDSLYLQRSISGLI